MNGEKLMDDTAKLIAIEEIKRLKSRYFYCLDHKNWEGWRENVFISNCVIDVPEAYPDPKTDLESFIADTHGALDGAVTIHHGHMPEIEITGPDTARGIWAMEDVIYWSDDAKFRDTTHTFLHGYGHYHETYVRTDDGWRIASLKLTRLRLVLQ
jgi:hypothetical protein